MTGLSTRPHRSARATTTALLVGLALVLAMLLAPGAQAAVGGFEGGDGDQLGACSTKADWQCLAPSEYASAIDGTGSDDDGFFSSKSNDPDGWRIGSGASFSSKTDIQAAWSRSYTSDDKLVNYLDLGFKRRTAGGDTFLGFELNQSAATYTNSAGETTPCRTTNDVLVSYEISPSSAVTIKLYKWVWDGGITSCAAGGKGHFQFPVTLGGGDAELALNTAAIDNYLSPGAGLDSPFDAGEFGEVAINLRALADAVSGSGAECSYFRHIGVTTRASSSISSNLEDYVAGGSIAARACGTNSPPETITPHIDSPADGYVSDTGSFTLEGTGAPDKPLTIQDGTTVIGVVDVNSSGYWTLPLTNVAVGEHAYTAVAGANLVSNTVNVTVTQLKPVGPQGPAGGTGAVAGFTPATGGGNVKVEKFGLFGPKGCVRGKFKSYVKTPGARRVVFLVDGKKYFTDKKANSRKEFVATINPKKLKPGRHQLKAKVYYKAPHKPRVFKLRFRVCDDKCQSRRKFRIHLAKPAGQTIRKATVFVNGKRVKVVRGRRLSAPVRLTGLPKGRFKVRIRILTRTGKIVSSTRKYRTCVPRKKKTSAKSS